ncbi:MAG: lactate dehydrogenase [Roseburia sp.]|nr:lactate dehydrogenase [Roseburia sp.]
MKITVYEVRPDEKGYLCRAAEQHGVELKLVSGVLTQENLSEAEGADGIAILGDTKLGANLVEEVARRGIRVVATRTIGYDHIDLNAAKSNGVHICNGYYDPDGVAEYTVMLMLMSLRNYKQALFRANANDYSLGGLMGKELRNLTVGIVGTGKIGQKVAQKLGGFGCEVLAYSRHQNAEPSLGIRYCTLEELYEKSDIISLHVPLSNQTRYMIDRAAIGQMKDGVILINCARGELMCVEDIIWGIETMKIGALGLDVIEDEEGIYHRDRRSDILTNRNMAYIRQFPNVTMTQHMAFYTKEAVKSMAESGIVNIVRCLQGQDNPNMIC